MSTEFAIRPPRTMLEVFESLPEGTPMQLIKNNLIMSPAPLDRHQLLSLELASELYQFVKKSKKGTVRYAPYDVYFDDENIFLPDILFVAHERMKMIKEDGFHGAPDLVIEILSPSTAKFDLDDKKKVYERYGVKEYWIIDPKQNTATGYCFVQDKYHEFFKGEGVIESRLLEWRANF